MMEFQSVEARETTTILQYCEPDETPVCGDIVYQQLILIIIRQERVEVRWPDPHGLTALHDFRFPRLIALPKEVGKLKRARAVLNFHNKFRPLPFPLATR